jgi:hypothetical protein
VLAALICIADAARVDAAFADFLRIRLSSMLGSKSSNGPDGFAPGDRLVLPESTHVLADPRLRAIRVRFHSNFVMERRFAALQRAFMQFEVDYHTLNDRHFLQQRTAYNGRW